MHGTRLDYGKKYIIGMDERSLYREIYGQIGRKDISEEMNKARRADAKAK